MNLKQETRMKKLISTEITESNITQIIELLSDTSRKFENLWSRFSEEQFLKPLGAGERSLTETLAHILHCEALSSEFIYLALLKNEVTFNDIHPEREYGKLLRYDLFDFKSLLEYFKFRRTVLLRVLSALTVEQWSRAISEKGKMRKESVYWRARTIALHELEHLNDIEDKLGKTEEKKEKLSCIR
jgi:restriction endonuclease